MKSAGRNTLNKQSENTFFPYSFFEIVLVALFTIEAVLILAVLFPPAIGREIDLSAPYSPRPEWYFLFLYQLTKYFPGRFTFVGAVLLPGIAVSLLLLAPFLDSSKSTALLERKAAAATGVCLLGAVICLTLLSLL
jgi:quinol-cytochrome oxidoreductase complex cytochrome b subunit